MTWVGKEVLSWLVALAILLVPAWIGWEIITTFPWLVAWIAVLVWLYSAGIFVLDELFVWYKARVKPEFEQGWHGRVKLWGPGYGFSVTPWRCKKVFVFARRQIH